MLGQGPFPVWVLVLSAELKLEHSLSHSQLAGA